MRRDGDGGIENDMVVLALDVGEARIGVAVSDPTELLASPRGVIRRRSLAQAIEAVSRMVAEAGAELVVVGLPISLDGQMHEQARAVQAFGQKLARRLSVPVVYWDERLSTVTATEALRAAGVRPDRIRERVDAAAAAIILQDYLDQRRRTAASASEAAATGRETPDERADQPDV
jgi:putative holliday junction resolvase